MVKTRVSISIDSEILSKLDRVVDGVSIQSRSEAIEKIVDKHISKNKKCVILAGGKIDSVYAEDSKIFKPLLKLKNGLTLIEDMIQKVSKAGYQNLLIVGSKEVLSEIYKVVGEGKDTHIEYLEERDVLGSAKTLAHIKDHVKSHFLFMPCDHYFELDLEALEKYHKIHKGTATLAVYSGRKYAWDKSSIVDMEGNLITSYEEEPKENKTYLTAVMIGIAEPEIFSKIPSTKLSYSLQKDLFPELAKNKQLMGYIFSNRWKNVHSAKDLKEI